MLVNYNKTFNTQKILPNIFYLIRALPDDYNYYKDHKIKQPGAILTREHSKILEGLNDILNCLDSIESSYKSPFIRDIPRKLKDIIANFDSFIDSCYQILLSICNFNIGENEKKFYYDKIKITEPELGNFFKNKIQNIKNFIDLFSNNLKHDSSLFDITLLEIENNNLIIGVSMNEITGKNLKQHYTWLPKETHNSVISFSINHLIKTLLLFYFSLCDSLESAIKRHLEKSHNYTFTSRKSENSENNLNSDFLILIKKIAHLSELYFPYEYKKSASICISNNKIIFSIKKNFNASYKIISQRNIYSGDGYTKEFGMTYIG